MYMNYRLMACGQFNQEEHEDIEDDDTPDTEDYEEDSESDVEDDNDSSASKDYCKEFAGPTSCVPSLASTSGVGRVESPPAPVAPPVPVPATSSTTSSSSSTSSSCCVAGGDGGDARSSGQQPAGNTCAPVITNDEGFIDESDCDCDTRNFSQDGESRVPFQYCFSCAPFHPSNGRGPTLVGPQLPHNTNQAGQAVIQEQEDKLIYDMDSKSTQNQSTVKRKRQISSEEQEDAINSILPKKRRDSNANQEESLDDSGFQEEEKVKQIVAIILVRHVDIISLQVFHPAFRDGSSTTNGMEVDQITSLVSIFSFGQQLFSPAESSPAPSPSPGSCPGKKSSSSCDDSDSDSDTSSDSGHSSDDHETNTEPPPSCHGSRTCLAAAKESDLDVTSVSVAAAV